MKNKRLQMIRDLNSFKVKDEFMTGYRIFFLCLMLLLAGILVGCNTDGDSGGGDDDDDDTPAGVWTLISVYYYDYNADDQLVIETDDNNANDDRDTGDVTWEYAYGTDGLRTGYEMFEGAVGINPDPDGIGTYYYDINDCNDRLEEETSQGTNLQVWTYSVDSECNRISYAYDGSDTTETGTYSRDGDGNVIELRLGNNDYWEYSLDANGDRLRYDFYQNDTLVRYGVYYYAGGQLDELRNFEKR
jgi:hypothetical protein